MQESKFVTTSLSNFWGAHLIIYLDVDTVDDLEILNHHETAYQKGNILNAERLSNLDIM